MILQTKTDFLETWELLGLYQQEIMKTGIIDYPFQYEGDIQIPLEKTTPEQDIQKVSDIQEPPVSKSAESINNYDSSSHSIVIKEQIISSSNPSLPMSEVTPIRVSDPLPTLREELLDQQAEELRLFYLYVHEVESTGNISKIPNVIRLKN